MFLPQDNQHQEYHQLLVGFPPRFLLEPMDHPLAQHLLYRLGRLLFPVVVLLDLLILTTPLSQSAQHLQFLLAHLLCRLEHRHE